MESRVRPLGGQESTGIVLRLHVGSQGTIFNHEKEPLEVWKQVPTGIGMSIVVGFFTPLIYASSYLMVCFGDKIHKTVN